MRQRHDRSGPRAVHDALRSWSRFFLILAVIVMSATDEELRVIRAEIVMLFRWSRDVVRYDVRWVVQEKLRVVGRRRTRSVKE